MPLRPGESFLQGSARVKKQKAGREVLAALTPDLTPPRTKPPPVPKSVREWEKKTPADKLQSAGFVGAVQNDRAVTRYYTEREYARMHDALSQVPRLERASTANRTRSDARVELHKLESLKRRDRPPDYWDRRRKLMKAADEYPFSTDVALGVWRGLDPLKRYLKGPAWESEHPVTTAGLSYGSPRILSDLWETIGKSAAALPAGVAGMGRHPLRQFTTEIPAIVKSVAQPIGLAMASAHSSAARQKVWEEFTQKSLQAVEEQFGPQATWSHSIHESYEQGLVGALQGLATVAPMFKGAALIRAVSPTIRLGAEGYEVTRGLGPRAAWREVKEPSTPRTLRYRGGSEATGVDVTARWSHSPFIRNVVQKPHDIVSRRIPQEARVIGAFSESRRAGRIESRRLRRQRRRDIAVAENALREAGLAKEAERLRVMFTRDKPEGVTEEEWLRYLMEDAQNMLDGEALKGPARDTPKIRKLRRQVAELRKNVDREAWLVEEEQRLSNRVQTAKSRGLNAERAEHELGLIREQLAVVRGQDVPPLPDSPGRVAMENAYKRQLPPEQVEVAMALADRLARGADPDNPSGWLDRIITRWAQEPSDVRLDPLKALLQEARRQEEPDAIPSADELRQVAFDGVDTSVFREHNIDDFLEKIPEYLKRGAPYRFWYENSGREILDFANGDKDLAARVAQVVAVMSASRNPRENINLALEAVRQYQAGKKIDVTTAPQNAKAEAIMRGEPWEGRKTNRFYANMLEDIDPERYAAEFPGGEVTNDIWMARLFGLKSDVPTPREYEAMAKIQQNIAAATGWKPKQIQAALWVPAKADAGRTITGPGGKKIRAPLSDDEAGIDFARALQEESVTMAVEAAPGRRAPGQELLRNYDNLDWEDKRAYTGEKGDAVRQFLIDAEIFGRVETEGLGIFEDATNPNFTITIPMPVERLPTGRISPTTGEEIKTPVSWTTPTARRHMTRVMSIIGDALNQDAMAWFRPIYRRDKPSAQNGALLKLSRPLTDDETFHFYNELKRGLGGDAPIIPAPDGNLYALNFSGAKNVAFHAEVERVLGDLHNAGEALTADRVLFRFDGDYRTRSRYVKQAPVQADDAARRAGRPDVREAARRLRERSEEIDRRYLGGPEPVRTAARAAPLEQPRFQATYPITGGEPVVRGAMELLGSDRYRQTIFASADISTVIHELGHIALHDLDPEDMAVLDQEFAEGRSFRAGEWTTEDHERYASAWEQFFMDGTIDPSTPTARPALRSTFGKLMGWMRSVYQGARAFDTPLSPEVERVFNKRLGRVIRDENNSLPPDAAIARWGTLLAAAESELERAEARNAIARYAGTDEALRADIDDLKKQRDEAQMDDDPELADEITAEIRATERELEQRDVLNAVRGRRRQKLLGSRIREIEKALEKPDSRRYAGAENAANFFQDERETILKDVLGDHYEDMFAGRREQMSRYLAEKGILPEAEVGEGRGFLPFRRKGTEGSSSLKQMAAPVSNRIRGRGKTSALNLHTRNQMILWQQGDYRADIGVLHEQYLRALSFKYQLDLREMLHSIGEPIDPESGPKDGWYLIDLDATPLPHHWKDGQTPEQIDAELARLMEGVTADDSQLALTLEKFAENWMHRDAGKARREDGSYRNVRQVHPTIVHQLMLPYSGNQLWNPAVKALTLANTLARISLIYTGPGYIPSNIVANSIMLFAERGPMALWDLYEGARMTTKDSHLARKILGWMDREGNYIGLGRRARAEMGETITTSMQRGDTGSVLAGTRLAEHKVANVVSSLADDWMRAAAWSGVARQMGYKGRDAQLRLLDGLTEKTKRDRDIVAERASQAMIDFDRLSPAEQRWLRPIVFVWPFIRGATAWPVDYVREHPFRAGATVALTQGYGQQAQEELGPTPAYYSSLVPIDVEKGEVANVSSVSPIAAFGDLTGILAEQVNSAVSGEPVAAFRNLAGFLAPPSDLALQLIRGQGEFGQAESIQELLKQAGPNFVPFWGLYNDVTDETKPAAMLDQGLRATIERKVLRFSPQRMNIAILNQQAEQRGAAKTVTDRLVEKRTAARSAWNQLDPGEHMPRAIEQSIQAYYTVQEMRAALKDEIKKHQRASWQPTRRDPKLTTLQEAAIVYDVLAAQHPDVMEDVPDPRDIFDEYGEEGVKSYKGKLEAYLYKGKNAADEAIRKAKLVKKAA